ncbi:MAG: hypothetical protein AAFV33_15815 [Chloroflexota bacterium]
MHAYALRLFFRVVSATFAAMIFLCGVAIASGSAITRAFGPLDAAPAMCDNRPCMMGMTVGLTGWTDVATVLQTPFDYSYGEKHLRVAVNQNTEVTFYPSVDGVHVGRGALTLWNGEDHLPVGWVVVWYGTPCGVSYYERPGLVVIRYSHTLVNVPLPKGERLSPHTAIESVHWQDPAYENVFQPDICVDNVTDGVRNSHWHGFASRVYSARRFR